MAADPRVARAVELAQENPERLLSVVGPTASGKTALAVEVAERVGGEIVSADSVQIYRAFDLGSGKATAEERARAPHHLIDALDPMEAVDAAQYAAMAERAVADVRARGKIPILVGGTFFWVRALVFGLASAPSADPEVRARHRELAVAEGPRALHAELARVDPRSAERLHPNDVVRVSRALEVFELSGRPLSEVQAEHGFREARLDHVMIGVQTSSDELDSRIRSRAESWLRQGWLEEVRSLLARGYGDARAMGSVGYKEVRAHLAGEIPERDLPDAVTRATRVFARRQRTWLARAPVEWL